MTTRADRIKEAIENIKGIVEDLKSDIAGYNIQTTDDDQSPEYEILTLQLRYKNMGKKSKEKRK